MLSLSLLWSAADHAFPQDGPPDIDFQFKVNRAIDKGTKYLKGQRIGKKNGNVLILLTYIHAGVPESDPDFQKLLKDALETKLEFTYQVALTAMSFEELDRVKYQGRIHQCAQFLADNIGPDGQTRYGKPTTFTEDIESVPTIGSNIKTSGTSDEKGGRKDSINSHFREKPRVIRIIQVKQRRPGPAESDHSNMQYAALGLRACHDAGMRFEVVLLKKVEQWWRGTQKRKAGATEEILHVDPPPSRTRRRPSSTKALWSAKVAPEGWCYRKSGKGGTRGSMTAGAVGALCILDYILGQDWRQDKDVLEGLQWINKNFSVTENPGLGSKHYYYYMYGLERAGMLFGTETIGTHRWYREGAEQLLKDQASNGSWDNAIDTCFAILFLKRATRRLDVATRGSRR
jgi:hypothetical protein